MSSTLVDTLGTDGRFVRQLGTDTPEIFQRRELTPIANDLRL